MSATVELPRIAVFGPESYFSDRKHGSGLWAAGIRSALQVAESEPILLGEVAPSGTWENAFKGIDGVVLAGYDAKAPKAIDLEECILTCRKMRLPVLAIDHGMHAMNTAFGGSLFTDIAVEAPEALQHRHPPERGLRHSLNVRNESRLARLFGEGEVIVNSEHRRTVGRLARAFRIGATALDGMIEAIETAPEDPWWALGIQWQPACATSSGLDIQIFRCMVDFLKAGLQKVSSPPMRKAA